MSSAQPIDKENFHIKQVTDLRDVLRASDVAGEGWDLAWCAIRQNMSFSDENSYYTQEKEHHSLG